MNLSAFRVLGASGGARSAVGLARPPVSRTAENAVPDPLRLLVVGGEDHALRIPFLERLARHGAAVEAAGTGDPAPFAAAGIPYHAYRLDRFVSPVEDVYSYRSLADMLRRRLPDIVQTFDTKPAILAPFATRATGVGRVVRTVNGLGWIYSSSSPTARALRPAFESLHRITEPMTARTVFQNRSDLEFFEAREIIRKGSGQLVPGSGVDIARFDHADVSSSAQDLRRSLGLEAAEVVITVSRLSRVKGIATLLEAARVVARRRPAARFVLVGPRESEGRQAIPQALLDASSDIVLPLGSRADIPELLAMADVFAFPTELREGVPRVLLEAALARLPIVTTAMPGCVDVVRHGVTGLLCAPGDPEALADTIVTALEHRDTSAEMAEHCRALVEREYSLDVTVARYLRIYRELARTRCSGAMRGAGEAAA